MDGVELPIYASGLGDANNGLRGMGLLEPTQILTPNITTSTTNSTKESNEKTTMKVDEDNNICTDEERKNTGEYCHQHNLPLNQNSTSIDVLPQAPHSSSLDIESNKVRASYEKLDSMFKSEYKVPPKGTSEPRY